MFKVMLRSSVNAQYSCGHEALLTQHKQSERTEECHQRWILFPWPFRYRVGAESIGLFQHLSLAFEIDLDIDVGGVDGDMTEPRTNSVDVHAGT